MSFTVKTTVKLDEVSTEFVSEYPTYELALTCYESVIGKIEAEAAKVGRAFIEETQAELAKDSV